MRRLRFRLRTLMIIVAFVALIVTVINQRVLLNRAAAREQRYMAELAQNRAMAVAAAVRAQAAFEQMSERLQQTDAGMMKKD